MATVKKMVQQTVKIQRWKIWNKFILFAAVFMLMKSWIHEFRIVATRGCTEVAVYS